MRPVGPDVPYPVNVILQELQTAVKALQTPGMPQRAYATEEADLPPAENWPLCTVLVTDLNTFATSTLVGSTWTWLRADGSAL